MRADRLLNTEPPEHAGELHRESGLARAAGSIEDESEDFHESSTHEGAHEPHQQELSLSMQKNSLNSKSNNDNGVMPLPPSSVMFQEQQIGDSSSTALGPIPAYPAQPLETLNGDRMMNINSSSNNNIDEDDDLSEDSTVQQARDSIQELHYHQQQQKARSQKLRRGSPTTFKGPVAQHMTFQEKEPPMPEPRKSRRFAKNSSNRQRKPDF